MSRTQVGPEHLPAVAAFARVAQHASFTRAAAELGVSPSALSQTVRALETKLGMRLLNRTTRRVGVTEAGAQFLQRVLPALEQLGAAFSELDELRGKPAGTLRINLPRMAMATLLAPMLGEFCRAYPEICLDLTADDRFVDLVGEGYDAGIRLGESVERDMVAIRLTPQITWSVVGAPSYFAKTGRPKTPEELVHHQAIRYRFLSSQTLHRWGFKRGKRKFLVDVRGGLIVNDRALLIDCAVKGLGLGYVSDREVQSHVAAGRLEPLLRSYIPDDAGLYLYFPEHSQTQLKLRMFIDMVRKMTAQSLGVKTGYASPR